MNLTQEIKAYALQLGFCKVGVTDMAPFPKVMEAAEERGHYDLWMARLSQGQNPRQIRPEGKSLVILALDQTRYRAPESLKKLVGQLNTPEAKVALAKQQETETSPWVREELAQALK